MTRQDALLEHLKSSLDLRSDVPVYQQLSRVIMRRVERGELRPGDSLPTVRGLAEALHLAPNTVAKAYAQLKQGGFTQHRAGAGTTVSASAWQGRLSEREGLLELRALLRQLCGAGLTRELIQAAVEAELRSEG